MIFSTIVVPFAIATGYWVAGHLQLLMKTFELENIFRPGWQHQLLSFVQLLLSRLIG